jgi:hypothetical protein
LVEDEPDMASALIDTLAQQKIVIDHVTTLIDAREDARLISYHARLLDRQLANGEGLKFIPLPSGILLGEAARSRCRKGEDHVRPRPMSQDDPKVRAAIGG